MARKFYTPIDLTGLELQNAKIQNLASDPTPKGKGHIYYNTVHNEIRAYDGTQWVAVGSALEYGNTASRPAAGNSGRAYADTQTGTLYVDNGTSWLQIGVNASDVSTAISNAALGSTDDLTEGTTNLYFTNQRAIDAVKDATVTFTNKTFQGDTYFQSGGGAGGSNNYLSVDNSTGQFTLHSGYSVKLWSSNDITLYSDGGNIVLQPDGAAYIGSASTNNRIATISDITNLGAIQSVSGTTDQITATEVAGDVTISLPSLIDVPNGELHLKKTEYWNTGTQYGVIDANSYSNNFNIVATGHNLELESQSGYNTFLNSGNATQITGNYLNSSAGANYFYNAVHIGVDNWNELNTSGMLYVQNNQGTAEFEVDTDNDVINLRRRGGNNHVRFNLGQYNQTVEFNNYTWLKFNGGDATDEQGEIYIDGGMYIYGANNAEVGIESSNNRVYLTSNGGHNIDFYTQGGDGNGHVHAHTSVVVNKNLTVGGNATDSILYVQNASATNVFQVDSGVAQTKFWGAFNGFEANDGLWYFNVYTDGGQEAIINAPNGDLILTADGAQYLNSNGTTDNLIATRGYVDNAVAGLSWKTAANLLWDDPSATLTGASGTLAIDNHATLTSANNGYRILIINGTNAGIWEYQDDTTNWTLTRTTDADAYTELKGAAIFIEEGDIYGQTSWVQSNHYLTSFTGQNWVQFSGSGTVTAGNGIAVNGQEVSVHKDDTLQFTGGALGVAYGDGIETDGSGKIRAHIGTGLTFDTGAITFASGYGVRKFAASIGDGSATSIDVTHNFNTTDVTVTIYDNSTKQEVFADVTHDTNKVTIEFADAPTTNQFRVVVVG